MGGDDERRFPRIAGSEGDFIEEVLRCANLSRDCSKIVAKFVACETFGAAVLRNGDRLHTTRQRDSVGDEREMSEQVATVCGERCREVGGWFLGRVCGGDEDGFVGDPHVDGDVVGLERNFHAALRDRMC